MYVVGRSKDVDDGVYGKYSSASFDFLEREKSPHMCTVRSYACIIGELGPTLGDRTARHVADRLV